MTTVNTAVHVLGGTRNVEVTRRLGEDVYVLYKYHTIYARDRCRTVWRVNSEGSTFQLHYVILGKSCISCDSAAFTAKYRR